MNEPVRPVLNVMRPLKAALEASCRYLAYVGYGCAYPATPFAHRITGGTVYVDGGANVVA
jgi:enoyl-[acyl-carrier-protein] reductase (NADH)